MSRKTSLLRRLRTPQPSPWQRAAPTAGGVALGLLVGLAIMTFGPAMMRYMRIEQM